MFALISPNELVKDYMGEEVLGCRVVDVLEIKFDLPEPLYWLDCPPEVNRHEWYVNANTFHKIPPIPGQPPNANSALEHPPLLGNNHIGGPKIVAG
jgi:hypothetical protein